MIASHSLPLRVTWNFDDADELRSRDEMICEQTQIPKRILPLCLEGDDPWRGGRARGEGRKTDGELDLVDGDWRSNDGANRVEFEKRSGTSGRRSSSSSSSRRNRQRRSGKASDDDDANQESPPTVDGVLNSPFSRTSSSSSSLRPRPLPPWTSQTYHLAGATQHRWWETSIAEILLSSIGFVGVSSGFDCVIRVKIIKIVITIFIPEQIV